MTSLKTFRNWFAPYNIKAADLAKEVQELIAALLPKFTLNIWEDRERDYQTYVKQYNGWVYACASKNASSVAQVPLRLYAAPTSIRDVREKVTWRTVKREQKQHLMTKSHLGPLLNNAADVVEIIDHPWLNLIRQVNSLYNGFELIELMELSLELMGNAFWYVLRQDNGVPQEIWPLQSQFVTIKPSPKMGVDAYEYGKDPTDKLVLDPEDVAHFRFPNPKNYFYGMGPLEAAQLPVILNSKFDVFENSILDNNAVMPFMMSTPQNLNEGAIERLRKDIEKVHKGYKKAGNFGLFTGGLEPKSLAVNPKDINYTDGHRITKEKIAAIFGVPLSLLTTEDVNKANATEGDVAYMRYTINPRLKRIEQTINQDIMPFYDDRIFVAFDNPVPEDKEYMLKEADTRMANYSLTINEYRERLGEDPVEWGEEPIVTSQQHPFSNWEYWRLKDESIEEASANAAADREAAAQAAEAAQQQPEEEFTEEEVTGEEAASHHHHHTTKLRNPEAHKVIEEDLRSWLRIQSTVVVQATENIVLTDPGVIDAFVPWSEIERQGKDLLEDDLVGRLHAGARKGAARVGSQWDVRNQFAVDFAEKYAGNRIQDITLQSKQAIRDIIADAIRDGDMARAERRVKWRLRNSIGVNRRQAAAQKKLEEKLTAEGLPRNRIEGKLKALRNKQINYRAEMIARTETAKAWAEGNMAAYRESGIEEKEFSAFSDACPICAPYDGKIFKMGDDTIQIPRHPNCRCDWLPVINF